VIVATSSPDDLFGDATSVAHSMGATNAVAFDLTAACSGFLFALVTGSQFLHTGTYKTAVTLTKSTTKKEPLIRPRNFLVFRDIDIFST